MLAPISDCTTIVGRVPSTTLGECLCGLIRTMHLARWSASERFRCIVSWLIRSKFFFSLLSSVTRQRKKILNFDTRREAGAVGGISVVLCLWALT